MLPRNHPDRIRGAFDDHCTVTNTGLILPVTLALRLGSADLVNRHFDLGEAPGQAYAGNKLRMLLAYALGGGDYISGVNSLRSGETGRVLGYVVKAPATLGIFSWGHVRQLDQPRRRSFDLRPGIHHLRNLPLGQRGTPSPRLLRPGGYHPLLVVAREVLMARLRKGRSNTSRGAAHFLHET